MFLKISLSAALLLTNLSSGNAETGVVALEDTPGCDYFVVETSGGFTLVEWYGGAISVMPGDQVFGDLHTYGFEEIYIKGRGEMKVWIENYWADQTEALKFFYGNCN